MNVVENNLKIIWSSQFKDFGLYHHFFTNSSKYPLLFRELLDNTPPEHPDYDHVTKTYQKVDEIARHIDNMSRNQDSLHHLTEFDRRVSGYPVFSLHFYSIIGTYFGECRY